MKRLLLLSLVLVFISCKQSTNKPQKSNTDISDISTKEFIEFRVEDSKYINVNAIWKPFEAEMESFSDDDYKRLKPLIFDKDIPTIQENILSKKLSYETLVKFYLYRIHKYDRANAKSLNSVISINPNILTAARAKDKELKTMDVTPDFNFSVYGMPILLKDNINTHGMPTTAGAVALMNNNTDDAFIVKQLKQQGAIILGKANLSEWAYFFCGDCPSGYSAVGGQTFNPYGRKTIDTGGSSSGSAVAVAANFCAAAIGSETSGSILSPASQNSAVGLKPTIGLVSRSGIIPISSTLDTAGPIAKNVTDTAILLGAIFGYDAQDSKSFKSPNQNWTGRDFSKFEDDLSLKGKTFGAFKTLLNDSLYVKAISILKEQGAEVVEFEPEDIKLPDFIRLLNLDMKKDLPTYFSEYGSSSLSLKSVEDVVTFNEKDSINKMPYGQKLFRGIVADNSTGKELENIKKVLKDNGIRYFDVVAKKYTLDGFLSINNYHAGFAAVAENPAITIPMGYTEKGEPEGLTLIGKSEKWLLDYAYLFEQASNARISPKNYQ